MSKDLPTGHTQEGEPAEFITKHGSRPRHFPLASRVKNEKKEPTACSSQPPAGHKEKTSNEDKEWETDWPGANRAGGSVCAGHLPFRRTAQEICLAVATDGLTARRCEQGYLSKAAPRPFAGNTYEPAPRWAEGAANYPNYPEDNLEREILSNE